MFISLCSSVSWYILFECDGKQTSFIFGLKKKQKYKLMQLYTRKKNEWIKNH